MTDISIAFAEAVGTQIAWAHALIRRPLPASDVSLARMRLLWHLHARGPQRITELAQADQVSQPSVTAMVGALERQGLVVRRPDSSDGRALAARLETMPVEKVRNLQAALEALQDLNEHLSSSAKSD
jgi:DNA-binding MarR family transcriptional regulator